MRLRPLFAACVVCALAFFAPAAPAARAEDAAPLAWQPLAPGMDMAVLEHRDPDLVRVAVLRIDPDQYEFCLFSSAWSGTSPRTLRDWAESEGLVAAINAGMYLTDGRTHTAYMRQGDQYNNSRLAKRYGAFFVAGPRRPALPPAAVLDRSEDGWQELLSDYATVVQNFRLIGPGGTQVWPQDGPTHAVAAVGEDADGHILFLHSRAPVSVHRFARALLACPALGLTSAMYVEGGAQAAMMLRLPDLQIIWTGLPDLPLVQAEPLLPNILGVKARGK